MAETTATPDTPSSDHQEMQPYWRMVDTILGGKRALTCAGRVYLPQLPKESDPNYQRRLATAPFTNIYADIVANLASKPFADPVTLDGAAAEAFADLAEDIDGRGNNLHVFAETTFFGGINHAVDWILVDFTKARPRADGQPLSLEEEGPRGQNLRPYWVRVPATQMLAAYTDTVRGQEQFVHARMRETLTRRQGFDEVCVERVRVFNREPVFAELGDGTVTDQIVDYGPATFEVWEQTDAAEVKQGAEAWRVVEAGSVTIGVIPLVPFVTGRRLGNSWRLVPPLQDVADLQIKHYQRESGLDRAVEMAAFAMLAANGIPLEKNTEIIVGPGVVLSSPPGVGTTGHGEWKFLEPSCDSLKFQSEEIDKIERRMRELGRQPLTATAGITVVTAALASQKASSVVQAWALKLKDALEQAFVLTAQWLGQSNAPQVKVFTDFAIEADDATGPEWIRDMAKRGRLSEETEWDEAQRRGVLSGDFEAERETERLALANQGLEGEDPLTDAAIATDPQAAA